MQVEIRCIGTSGASVPATLLGQNLELAGDTSSGILADRLSNPHFAGPADPQTGVAPGWQPGQSRNPRGMRFELTPGMGLSGGAAQLIHNYSGRGEMGLMQTGRWIRADETLRITLWARAQHHPVTIRLGLRPLVVRAPSYSEARIAITATYWREYQVTLQAPSDDPAAVFYCYLEEPGLVWLDQIHLAPEGSGVARQDVLDAFRSLEVPVLRFPGGSVTGGYHWRHGTGPAAYRPTLPDPVFKWAVAYDFGTDEYLEMCIAQGIIPQITVNIGAGTPQEAGEWAAYVAQWYRSRGLTPPPMYWQIGNEQYGAWEVGNMSGEMYVRALEEFVPAVRRGYPAARIIGLGPAKGEGMRAEDGSAWRQPVLASAGRLLDLIALQWYTTGWDEDPSVELLQALRGADALATEVGRAIADCREHSPSTRVAVTEWNYWGQASHYDDLGFLEPYDVQHGLFVAAVLHRLARLAPELELANFYHLLNPMGVFISRGPTVEETPLAALFRLYRPTFPGQLLPLQVQGADLAAGLPAVDALALSNAAGDWLLAANFSPSESAVVRLAGMPPYQQGTALVGVGLRCGWKSEAVPIRDQSFELTPQSIARLHGPAKR